MSSAGAGVDVALQDWSPTAEELQLRLSSGTMRVRRYGPAGAPLVLCAPGLTANARTFDFLAERLAGPDRAVAALDLRGRGRSSGGPPGSFGWANHARDVVEAAGLLGAKAFDYVGHSMGAFVGLALARMHPGRVRRAVLIDAVGVPDPAAMPPIFAAVQRLGAVHPGPEEFLARVRALGAVEPWSPYWEEHYREDLVPAPGGVRPRADPLAVAEDLAYAAGQDVRRLWPYLGAPALLVRAARPIGAGFIVTSADRDAFLRAAPRAQAVEVDANHYGVVTHPATAEAVKEFIG